MSNVNVSLQGLLACHKRAHGDEYYKVKRIELEISVSDLAFIDDDNLICYIAYRLNLGKGSDGQIILDKVTLLDTPKEV